MTTLAFALDGDYIELKSLLKLTGLVGSGGEAKVVIDDGQVTVDAQVETRKACKIRLGQVVEYAGTRILIEAA